MDMGRCFPVGGRYLKKKQSLEMRSIRRDEFIEYFAARGETLGGGYFQGPFWEVHLSDEEILSLGMLRIPSTFVTFSVEGGRLDEFVKAFRMSFMRAGG